MLDRLFVRGDLQLLAWLQLLRGMYQYDLMNVDGALEHFMKATVLDNEIIYHDIGAGLKTKGDYAGAEEYFRKQSNEILPMGRVWSP